MTIRITTDNYLWTHGRKPRGTGCWAFTAAPSHGQPQRTLFAPPLLTFREACAWVRREVRRQGWQDLALHVAA